MTNIENKKQQLKELLKIHYGFEKFRPGQENAIDNILAGKSSIVIMPTGGGKSLIFQLPSLVLDGVTIVISPLIALMKDQVDALVKVGIPATFVNSSIAPAETYERLEAVKNNEYNLLYIAPERFYNQEFLNALKNIKVSLFAIDEAHCISQWGHDFRPSYLKLKQAIELVGQPPVVALTATATPEVREDIIRQLGLPTRPELIITGFSRPNLQFGVIQVSESRKPQLAVDAISSVHDQAGIIYVGTRAKADELTQILLENNIEAVVYHAGMEAEDRKWVQENFMSGRAKVIVATNAFGLGIDKSDIRFVIHYDMPGTIEAYYQEAGRAGRDGRPSFCLMLYSPKDRHLREFFIKGDNPPPNIILEIYETLLNYESNTILITYGELAEIISENVPEMAIGTSLKILEREGYITRPHEKTASAYLRLTADFEQALSALGSRAKTQIDILSKLHEKYKKEILSGWRFNLEETASVIDAKKETLVRLIKKLAELNLAEYQPPFRGTEIKILKRVNPEEIEIDFSALKEKLKRAYEKLDKMEEYVYCFNCRQKFILDYFNDETAKACLKCDNCLTTSGYERKYNAPREKEKMIIRGTKKRTGAKPEELEVAAPEKKPALSTKLTQLETLDLFNKGLSISSIAKERELKDNTIIQHICFLIEKKLIKPEAIDKLINPGIQKKIIKATHEIGIEKLKPIYEYLGEQIDYDQIKLTLAKLKTNNK